MSMNLDVCTDKALWNHFVKESPQGNIFCTTQFLDAIAGVKPRPHVVLRIHPKDEVGEYVIYKNELDQISSDEFSLELI